MPYKTKGKVVYHKKGGKWKVKQRCKTAANARAARRLLEGVKRGWKPTGKKKRKKKRKSRKK